MWSQVPSEASYSRKRVPATPHDFSPFGSSFESELCLSRIVRKLSAKMRTLPEALRKLLTWDRGLELASRKRFTIATGMAVYFCDPQSPW